jgi:uncharacterized protein (DUF736 family)
MAYEKRNNEGVLFENNKGDNPKRPDYKGTLTLPDGHEVEIVAWEKEGKNSGKRFLSLKLGNYTSPRQTAHDQAKANGYQPQSLDVDAGVPF